MRRLEIELRNGPALPAKLIDKENGRWVELNPMNERLVRKEVGRQARRRARCASATSSSACLLDEAARRAALHHDAVRRGLREPGRARRQAHASATGSASSPPRASSSSCGDAARRSASRRPARSFGYLCVEGHGLRAAERGGRSGHRRGHLDARAGAARATTSAPRPGAVLPVENPAVWVYPEEVGMTDLATRYDRRGMNCI